MSKQIIISKKLVGVLKNIDHRFSKVILDSHQNKEMVVDNSYIDYDISEGMVTYLPSNRELNQNGKSISESDKWVKGRQSVTFGKFVRAVLSKKGISFKDNELEDYVNEYKAQQVDFEVKIVEGSDIIKWYKESNYEDKYRSEGGGSLYGSCMRNVSKDYLEIYSKNCSMFCLISKESGKLLARAILWNNANINGVDVPFLDRMYCSKLSLENAIKSYCKKKGWFYKTLQGAGNSTISNGVENINNPKIKVKIKGNVNWEMGRKPYIDTLAFFGYNLEDGKLVPMLTSLDSSNFKLQFRATDGSYGINSRHNGRKDLFNKRIETYDKFLIKYDDGFAWIDDTDYSRTTDIRDIRYVLKLVKDSEEFVEVRPNTCGKDGLFVGVNTTSFLNGKAEEMLPYHIYLFDLFEDDAIFKPFKHYEYLNNRTDFRIDCLNIEHFKMVLLKAPNLLINSGLNKISADMFEVIMETKPSLVFDMDLGSFLAIYKKLKSEHIIKYLEKYPDLVYDKTIKVKLSKQKIKRLCLQYGTHFHKREFGGKMGSVIGYTEDPTNAETILIDAFGFWFGRDVLPTNTKVKIREIEYLKQNIFERIAKMFKGDDYISPYKEVWTGGTVTYSSYGYRPHVRINMNSGENKTINEIDNNFVIVERSLSECVYISVFKQN